MGAVNQFEKAVELCCRDLGFDIAGEATAFRLALDRAGSRRFEHCVTLVKWWARPYHHGSDKYDRLMRLLWLVTPEKVGKYRDQAVGAAVRAQDALEAELGDILRREP